jgi:hypothetical protein
VKRLAGALVVLASCKDDARPKHTAAEQQQAAQKVDQLMRDEGIHQKGTTAVSGEAIEAIARSFVAVMGSGDARAAIRLVPELEGWSVGCRTAVQNNALRLIGESLGGQLVTTPRGVTFASIETEPQRLFEVGARLAGCEVAVETMLEVATVHWKTEEGVAGMTTLELVRFGDRPWAVLRVVR